jgi:4-hydroxy-tetrahydrodipicolinate synthase
MTYRLNGVIPPLTTPFKKNGEIYENGLRELIEFQIQGGSNALFICGTYGSGPLMTEAERSRVHHLASEYAAGRMPLIAHIGSPSTALSVRLTKDAQDAGVNAIASVPPFYYKHDERSILEYFRAIVGATDLPVYVYNNPGASGNPITPNMLRALSDIGVKGIKDSSFSLIAFSDFILSIADSPDFNFVIGTEALALPAFLLGAEGCVSGLANVFPEFMKNFWEIILSGDYKKASKMQMTVSAARQVLHLPGSTNAACYAVLKQRGVDVGHPRAPILDVDKEFTEKMVLSFRELGVLS